MSNLDFSPLDVFTFGPQEDALPSFFLEDVSTISFDLWDSDPINNSTCDFPGTDYEKVSGVVHDGSMGFLEETCQMGIFPPILEDYVPTTPPLFDGEIPTEDTAWVDLQRYIERHGRPPSFNPFEEYLPCVSTGYFFC